VKGRLVRKVVVFGHVVVLVAGLGAGRLGDLRYAAVPLPGRWGNPPGAGAALRGGVLTRTLRLGRGRPEWRA
jgi:hypothetical protein